MEMNGALHYDAVFSGHESVDMKDILIAAWALFVMYKFTLIARGFIAVMVMGYEDESGE